ncbi:6-hydroxy-D-nicotine oxidase, partial [Apiospora kogelbergensis]
SVSHVVDALTYEPSLFSPQLLRTLDQFDQDDALIASLSLSIQRLANFIDQASHNYIGFSSCESYARSQRACQILQAILPDYYADVNKNQSIYDTLRDRNWSSNCDLPAACFVTPEHPAQVAISIQVITRFRSKFAVRSGGHNPNPGFAGVGLEGVTIDTQRFQKLQLSNDKLTTIVGAGLRFGAVQEFLAPHDVAVVSGRNVDVGVSGLLLGGGHPIINSMTGLAADNIKSIKIVLSDSTLVTASRNENEDLFRALKGGGNNFGIVTEFELYTTMPNSIWYHTASYDLSKPREVLNAFVEVQRNMERDPKAGIQMTYTPNGFTVVFVYGEHTEDPAVFSPFRHLVSTAVIPKTNGTALNFIKLQSPAQPKCMRDTVASTTLPETDLYIEVFNQYIATVMAHKNTSAAFVLPIQTFNSEAARIADRNGGNVLGTSYRAQTWWNPIAQWTDPAESTSIRRDLLELGDFITKRAQAKGLHDKFIFSNIAAGDQNVLASYGRQNMELLRLVSKEYDGTSAFQTLQNGGFLISKS